MATVAAGVVTIGACSLPVKGPQAESAKPAQVATQDDGVIKVKEGENAPDFSEQGSNGKTHTLKSLTAKGPVFLYFVKATCGANPAAVPLFNQIYKAYGEKANFVAVIDADGERFSSWKKEFDAPYEAILDADKSVIKAYGVKASQAAMLVNKDGKIEKIFRGFGQQSLTDLETELAKAGKVEVKKLDFARAPKGKRYG